MVILLVTYLIEALLYLFVAHRVSRVEHRLGHTRKHSLRAGFLWPLELERTTVYLTRSFADVCRWKSLMSAADL